VLRQSRQVSRYDASRYMDLALRLAEKGRGSTSPNPMVGAVLVASGRVLATGYHRKAGAPHAEILALTAAGRRTRGATLYVNLEPCCHLKKRTPPCVPSIITAGIKHVVVAMRDPNPLVNGRGLRQLRRAGIRVTEGVLREEATGLNEAYIHWMRTRRPFVILKAAMTLDGKIATAAGESRWISGEVARRYVHQLRRQVDAILVGVHTVLHDDPELTARLSQGRGPARYATHQPLRVVLDSHLQLPPRARVLKPYAGSRTLLATTAKSPLTRVERFRATGLEVMRLPSEHGRVSLKACLTALGARGVTSVLIEGGGEVIASALRAGLVNRLKLIVAPLLLGGQDAIGLIGGRSPKQLADGVKLTGVSWRRLGSDILIDATPR
jgi:diaminohydroxyphosphoribosylaminopyrimidine deaminase/5-amino-6-(5-phosphoribosylamino)uracil reductase